MMKKFLIMLLAVIMVVSVTSCNGTTSSSKTVSIHSIEELETAVNKDITDTEGKLRSDYEKLMSDIDSYSKYTENKDEVQKLYDEIRTESKKLGIRMREYTLDYSAVVTNSSKSLTEKQDEIEDLYDCIYTDACEDIYDKIYEGLLSDIYDSLYEGVVGDGYNQVGYKEWYDTSSEAYNTWMDCLGDVYDEWLDCGKDIYRFLSDVNGHLYNGDSKDIKEDINKFKKQIKELKQEK